MVWEEQFLVCKFGDSLDCGGVRYTPIVIAYLVCIFAFFGGFLLRYFVDWFNTQSRKDRVEDVRQAISELLIITDKPKKKR